MAISAPAVIKDQYQEYLNSGKALAIQQRLAKLDSSLWSQDEQVQASIDQRLGWINCIDKMQSEVERINAFVNNVWVNGFRHCVLLGMGGSSLAPEAFSLMFSDLAKTNSITLDVLDNTSPDAINQLAQSLNWDQTLFIVASKSGTTIESDSMFRFFFKAVKQHSSKSPGDHFVAITDPDSPLQQLARESKFFDCFTNPADIGGRFSVLSLFGLVPAALVGVDIDQLLNSAKAEQQTVMTDSQRLADASQLGLVMGLSSQAGLDKLVLNLDASLVPFACWLEQLVAESTGKSGKGILPVILANEIQTSGAELNQCSVSIQSKFGEISVVCCKHVELANLGGEFFKWEWATAFAGVLMQINPFDEPNVSENKKVTVQVLGEVNQDASRLLSINDSNSLVFDDSENSHQELEKRMQAMLISAKQTDYVAILAYTSDPQGMQMTLGPLRQRIREKYQLYSTYGTGPRYLHSTGQLHKGGDNNGIFVLITQAYSSTAEIPGSDYSFDQLNAAQALGDLKVLKARSRRIIHIHLADSDSSTREQFAKALSRV